MILPLGFRLHMSCYDCAMHISQCDWIENTDCKWGVELCLCKSCYQKRQKVAMDVKE